jgi:hypothetical protein
MALSLITFLHRQVSRPPPAGNVSQTAPCWPHLAPQERRWTRAHKQPSSGPSIPQLLVANAVGGAVVGLGIFALLLLLDLFGLGALLAGDEHGSLLVIVIALQFAVGFAAFAAATGVFLLDAEPDRRP